MSSSEKIGYKKKKRINHKNKQLIKKVRKIITDDLTGNLESDSDYIDESDHDKTAKRFKTCTHKTFKIAAYMIVFGIIVYIVSMTFSAGFIYMWNIYHEECEFREAQFKLSNEEICSNTTKLHYYANTLQFKKCKEAFVYLQHGTLWHTFNKMFHKNTFVKMGSNFIKMLSNIEKTVNNEWLFPLYILVIIYLFGNIFAPITGKILSKYFDL